ECHLGLNVERERGVQRGGEPGLGSVSEGRWESSWVPLGLDHMCLRGGSGGPREQRGQRGGSAESDGPRP
ncbi:hypothetical protein JOQ06_006423, partial [Pogonophryne albipinna]